MSTVALGAGEWALVALYLSSTIGIGWLAYRARRADTLSDFYLAGRGLGVGILLLTLFATQYSGNTFFAFSGKTYRIGFAWVMSLHFMIAVVACYLLYAPRLYPLARRHGFVTPADFVEHRFGHAGLSLLTSVVMIVALANFLLGQLMAMGHAVRGLTADGGTGAYAAGVAGLALIMLVYGSLGGLRAVAWTDAIQGALMMVGFAALFVAIREHFGPVAAATERLLDAADAATRAKALPPPAPRIAEWYSYIAMVGIGAALYPQAIQRVYAARSARVLRRSLSVMAILPLPTQLVALLVGITAAAFLPGIAGTESDAVLTRVLLEVRTATPAGQLLVVTLMAAVLAAMMSTADSALLSISSMFTSDVYARHLRPAASQAELTRVGKLCSWGLVAVLVVLAIVLRERTSLVRLIDRKFDLLVQLAPAFMLGVRWPGLRGGAVLCGAVAGIVVALTLAFAPLPFVTGGKVGGVHPGLYGLALNLAIAVLGSRRPAPACGASPGAR